MPTLSTEKSRNPKSRPFEPVGMDQHGMGDVAPFAHEPRAGLQRNRRRGPSRLACLRIEVQALQLAHDRLGEAAVGVLLKPISDRSGQEIAGEAHRRRRPMQPAPLDAQLEEGHLREPREGPATSTAALFMSATAPGFDAVAAEAIIGGERKIELLFHRARQKPTHVMLLPADGLHHLFDARSFGPAQQREHALPLGHVPGLWSVVVHRRFGGGDWVGLRFDRTLRCLGGGRMGPDLVARWRRRFTAALFSDGAMPTGSNGTAGAIGP